MIVLTVNMHEAKTNLSKLVQMAVDGQPFVIANRGKPMVTVRAVNAVEEKPKRRFGFMKGKISVPDDFDTMFQQEIEDMFYNSEIFPAEHEDGSR